MGLFLFRHSPIFATANMKHIAFLLLSLFSVSVSAQTFEEYKRQSLSDFKKYKSDRQREFKEYRDRVNAEFAEYMRQAWPQHEAQPATPAPHRPEPPQPVIKKPDDKPSNTPVAFGNVIPTPAPVTPPQPATPLPVPEPQPAQTAFTFYGTTCEVSLGTKHRFTLQSVDENAVADAWVQLSSDVYLTIVSECLAWRDRLHLCDWGYVRFVERMAMSFFPSNKRNEALLLQMYVLTQSGYKVRIARAGNQLALLLPSPHDIYGYPYLSIRGCKYYIADPTMRQTSFCILDREFPKEQFFSLQISTEPQLSIQPSAAHSFLSKAYPDAVATIKVNRNLIDFYNDYPLCSWNVYAQASLSTYVKKQLYPVLKQAIAGKGKTAAANILINFVQTAFSYKTDEEQFGTERPLFADETFFYPYSDCEDRAILYAILVHDLLDLSVVLLQYPDHLATAVCFNEDITGDHLMLEGEKYLVCDPTYIGASVGDAMPQFKQVAAKVIKLN